MGKTSSNVFGPRLEFRAAFLAVVAVAVTYATALLSVLYLYRKRYGIVAKPELALHYTAKILANIAS